MLITNLSFPIQGPLREISLFLEVVLVFFCLEIGLIFIIRIIKQEKKERTHQEISYSVFTIGYAVMYSFIIIADYMTETIEERAFFLLLMAISILIYGNWFLYEIERDEIFFKKYFFLICGIFLSIFTIFVTLLPPIGLKFHILVIPLFAVAALFVFAYVRNYLTNKLIKNSKIHYRRYILIFTVGIFLMAIGFFFTAEFFNPFYTMELRLLGAIFQFIGAFLFFIFFITSPPLAEYAWQDKIHKIFIMSKGGICLYSKIFYGGQDTYDRQSSTGALKVVDIVINEMTKKSGFSTIEKDNEVFLLYPKEDITGVIVSSVKLGSFKVLMEKFMKAIEDIYSEEIKQWDTHSKLFAPIETIAREIFLF